MIALAEWRCLTPKEQEMVRTLGYCPEPMMVNRVGEGHWMFKDLKTQAELLVSHREDGTLRATLEVPRITPPRRVWMHPGENGGNRP